MFVFFYFADIYNFSTVNLFGCWDLWVYCDRKEEKCRTQRTVVIGTNEFRVFTKGRLGWLGHVESKDDPDWIKRTMMEMR